MGRAALAAGMVALVAFLAAAMPASALPRDAVKELRQEPCPAPYLVAEDESTFTPAEVNKARRWRFKIAHTYVRLKPRVNWRRDPVNSQTFRAGLVGLNWMRVLFFDYLENGNEASLRKARALAVDFVRNQRPGGRKTSDESWEAKTVGDRAATIAYVTRAASCEGQLRRARAKTLLRSVEVHGRWLLRHRVATNHGLFDALGLAAISRQANFLPDADRWRNVGRDRFESILRRRLVAGEGFWLEHSASYQWAVTNLLDRLLEILRIGPGDLKTLLEKMERNSALLVSPDRRIVQFGDSPLRRAPDAYRDRAETLGGVFGLPRSGFAFVRDGDRHLAQIASFHNTTHKHSDELSFDLFDAGHRIVSDTGLYHKDPGPWFRFTRSARAHSSVTVDGKSFGRRGRLAYGSGIDAWGTGSSVLGGDWYAIKSHNPLVRRQGVKHSRWLVYKPGFALIVADRLRSGRRHSYRSHLQLGPDIAVDRQPDRLALSAAGFNGALFDTGTGRTTRSVARGERRPLQGWTSPQFREKQPRSTAIFKTRGDDVDRVATFSIANGEMVASAEGRIGGHGLALELRTAAGIPVERVVLGQDGRSIEVSSGL